jgi:hypothetical protein
VKITRLQFATIQGRGKVDVYGSDGKLIALWLNFGINGGADHQNNFPAFGENSVIRRLFEIVL